MTEEAGNILSAIQITSLVVSIDVRVSQCVFNSCKAPTARVGFF